MQLRTFVFVILLVLGYWYWHGPSRQLPPPGMAVATGPAHQSMVSDQGLPSVNWPVGHSGYTATPFATYHLRARVLGMRRYHDQTADFAPSDYVLGWGRLSDPAVYGPLDITPVSRSYQYKVAAGLASREEVNDHSAGYHVIPANEEVAGLLGDVNLDDIVTMDGYLVAVRQPYDADGSAGTGRVGDICATCHMFRVTRVAVEPRATP